MLNLKVAALTAVLLIPAAAVAQGSSPAMAVKKDGKDPNKVVCRTMDTTGSRLQKKRECHTNAQWAEETALQRQAVERQQANRWKND